MPLPAAVVAAGAAALRDAASGVGQAVGQAAFSAAARGLCNAHANNPSAVGGMGRVATSFVNGACRPYYDNAGITPPGQSGDFKGGQCVGVPYRIRLLYDQQMWDANCGGNAPTGGAKESGTVIGPITKFTKTPTVSNCGGKAYSLEFYNSSGSGNGFSTMENFSNRYFASVPNAFLVRADGQPDNCGNPPPVFTPSPNAPNVNYGDTINIDASIDGGPTTISIGLPSIDVDGNFSLPVTIGDTEIDFGLNGGVSPEGTPAEGVKPVSSGPPLSPDQLGESGGDFPPPPEGMEYVGALFNLTQIPVGAGMIPGTLPERVFPRTVGNARLKLATEDGVVSPTVNHQWREEGFALYRPFEGLTVRGAYANVLEGFLCEVIPLLRSLPEDV